MTGVLQGRRMLITGASSGIGAAIAVACADAGAVVAGLARRVDRLATLQASHGLTPIEGDIRDMAAAPSLVEQAATSLGGLDAVVHAAGIARPGLIADADPTDWAAMFETNVLGLLAITQAAIPHLLRSGVGASIVTISSMSGRRVPAPAGGTYAATKFAVHAISESLRQELQPKGIRVTTISPGFVNTDLFEGQPESVAGRYQQMVRAVGIDPSDVAAAVIHALSAPAGVTTVEVAMVPTLQDDSRYAADVGAED